MPTLTPQTITKAVIKEMVEKRKDVKYAVERMIDIWKDAYPVIRYVDDVDSLRSKEQRKEGFKKSANASDELGLGFDEVWGADLNDVSSFIGVAVSTSKDNAPSITEVSLNAHITEGLTRAQLEKTGFVEHGGLVLTFLNPMLKALEVKLRKGSHVVIRGQRYAIVESKEIVNWPDYKGELYMVCNCV